MAASLLEADGAGRPRAAMSASNASLSGGPSPRAGCRPRRCSARCVAATAGTAVVLAAVAAVVLGVMVRPAMGAASTAAAVRAAAQSAIPPPAGRPAPAVDAAAAPFKPAHGWHRSNIVLVRPPAARAPRRRRGPSRR
jgi:hypothetical protein